MHGEVFDALLSDIRSYASSASDPAALASHVVEAISRALPYYNWVGFYMLDPDDSETLVLGPFRGAPTEHVRIRIGQGICGAAIARNETVVVDDVSADPRYLACSAETRSEIVVPIRAGGAVAGEIDVDGHATAAFSSEDWAFLETCAELVGRFIERSEA